LGFLQEHFGWLHLLISFNTVILFALMAQYSTTRRGFVFKRSQPWDGTVLSVWLQSSHYLRIRTFSDAIGVIHFRSKVNKFQQFCA